MVTDVQPGSAGALARVLPLAVAARKNVDDPRVRHAYLGRDRAQVVVWLVLEVSAARYRGDRARARRDQLPDGLPEGSRGDRLSGPAVDDVVRPAVAGGGQRGTARRW